MRKIFLFITLVFSLQNAFALRLESGSEIVIDQPVYENLYIAGGKVTINAPIHGDLIVAGGTITINDTVTNDIIVAGGTVEFKGFVGDDIRCAGGSIHIFKNIRGDVVVSGGTVIIDKSVSVGDLLASGGKVTVDGIVKGGSRVACGEFILNGEIAKDFDCRGGLITINGIVNGKSILAAKNIEIGSNAAFNSDVRYWTKNGTIDFKQSLKNARAVYDSGLKLETGNWYFLGAATILMLLWYLSMALLMILIIQYLFSNTMKKAADTASNNALQSLGIGFLFFVAVPVAAIIAFVTIIGVPVGLLLIFSYLYIVLHIATITSVVGANWINNRYNKNWDFWRLSFTAFAIFIIIKFLASAPLLGWLFVTLITCTAFGGILNNVNWKRKTTVVSV